MINLHAVTRPVIRAVNPDQAVVILASAGWSVDDVYRQRPIWRPAVRLMAQVQPVPDKTLQFLVQQRDNTIWRDFYLPGDWSALVRADERGGDLIYWDGYEWQADQVVEGWSPTVGWTKLRCVRVRACPPPKAGAVEPPAAGEAPA